MKAVRLLYAALLFFLTACSPSLYEIKISTEDFEAACAKKIIVPSSNEYYDEGRSAEIYSSKKFIILVAEQNAVPSEKIKIISTGSFFTFTRFSPLKENISETETELHREFYYPCTEFAENLMNESWDINSFTSEQLEYSAEIIPDENESEKINQNENTYAAEDEIYYSEEKHSIEKNSTVEKKSDEEKNSSGEKKNDDEKLNGEENSENESETVENKIFLFTFENIPEGYIALPVTDAGEIFYPDNKNYPLYKSYCTDYSLKEIPEQIQKNKKQTKQFYTAQKRFIEWYTRGFVPLMKEPWKNPDIVTVASCGDMMLARGVENIMMQKKSAEPVFTTTLPYLQNCDFTIGNLEGVITDLTLKTPKTYNFKFNKKVLPYLKEAGFDYLMLTNNHSYDYGEQGFKDTLNAVKNAGFATSGAGLNADEAKKFYHTKIKENKLSVISCGAYPLERSGFNGKKMATATETRAGILWESDELLADVKKQKEEGNIVIVNVHGGAEYHTKPTEKQERFYKALCDSGADIVFGSHPHVLQPVELYGKSLIVWSLGNFIFPGMDEMPGGTDSMIIQAGFLKGRFLYYKKIPAVIEGTKVSVVKE